MKSLHLSITMKRADAKSIKEHVTEDTPADLPSKYVNFEDPNSSNRALRAASSA